MNNNMSHKEWMIFSVRCWVGKENLGKPLFMILIQFDLKGIR